MGDRYEIVSILYSRYGFRNHRGCSFRIRVTYPDGKKRTFYYENIPDIRKLSVI